MAAKKAVTNARRSTIARAAIAHAKKTTKDPRLFVEELRKHAFGALGAKAAPAARRSVGRGLSLGLRINASKAPQGPRLADDPRYMASLRELAKRTTRNTRIIGGSTVSAKEFPDCVAVGNASAYGCTGTLIAPNVVLTAGHCESLHDRILVGTDVDKKGTVYRVKSHVRHPKYASGNNANDLMLLILEKAVKGVKPRAIAPASVIDAAVDGRVVGFGTTDLGGTLGFGQKQQTDVPIVSRACSGKVGSKKDGKVYGCHLGKEIVAGKPLLNHDTCKGDSGGPFYVAKGKQWLLAGVTSRGTDLATTMCGDGGIYTRVDKYATWIASVIG